MNNYNGEEEMALEMEYNIQAEGEYEEHCRGQAEADCQAEQEIAWLISSKSEVLRKLKGRLFNENHIAELQNIKDLEQLSEKQLDSEKRYQLQIEKAVNWIYNIDPINFTKSQIADMLANVGEKPPTLE